MSEIPQLTLNFATNHPREAAKALEQLAVDDSVAFIEQIPPEAGSRLLSLLAPQYAGQCLLIIDPKSSATLIQGMRSTSTLSILRLVPSAAISSLLDLLSADKKVLLEKRLSFPQNTVGSWMDFENPPVSDTALVGDLRRSLRSAKDVVEHALCVVKTDGTIAGLLRLSRLATAKDGSKVSKIMVTDFKSVLDRDSLQSAASLTDWDRFDALPVTNRKGIFIGMLTQRNLKKGLSFSTGDVSPNQTDAVLEDCMNAYTSTLSWLVQTALSSPLDPITYKKVTDDR